MKATDAEIEDDRHDRSEGLCLPDDPRDPLLRHEVLDRASLLVNLVEDWLLAHPALARDPDWYRLAYRAQKSLGELYARVGREGVDMPSGPPAADTEHPSGHAEAAELWRDLEFLRQAVRHHRAGNLDNGQLYLALDSVPPRPKPAQGGE